METTVTKNLLFYSEKCLYCKLFIKKLNDEQLLPEFRLIDVHELKTIPPAITDVPTIIVKNINIPMCGISAFNWLENSKYFYQKTNNVNVKVRHIDIKEDISMANEHEKKKKSDDFANILDEDDDKRTKNKYISPNQNVSITNSNDITQQVRDQKINPNVQTRQLNELVNVRKMQMLQFMKAKGKENSTNISNY
jgi:hypothetical protein